MATAQVAIIGGGVIGAAIAWALGERGVTDVVLLERASLASGATGICPGGLRQQFEGEADCLLARYSLRVYETLQERLASEIAFVIERAGYLFIAHTPARLARFEGNVAMQNRLGIPSRMLSVDEIQAIVPGLVTADLIGGAFCAEDGFLEDCHGVTHAFAARARERGARVLYQDVVAVRPPVSAGPWRIEMGSEATLEAEHVVVATGAEAVPLLQALVALPIVAERRRLAFSAPVTPGQFAPLTIALDRGFAGKQLTSGVFYMGWLGESPAADDLTFIEETLTRGMTLYPPIGDLAVRRVLGGPYDNTPDRRPLLGAVPGIERLWLAVGFSGHGFMIAPAVAEIVSAAVIGAETTLPTAPFALERFASQRVREGLFI